MARGAGRASCGGPGAGSRVARARAQRCFVPACARTTNVCKVVTLCGERVRELVYGGVRAREPGLRRWGARSHVL